MSLHHPADLASAWQIAFDQHAECGAPATLRYRIAGRNVCVRLAERRFAPLARALSHRRWLADAAPSGTQVSAAPELEILVWSTTDAAHWRRLLQPLRGCPHGAPAAVGAGTVRATFDSEHRLLCAFDAATGRAAYVMFAYERLPFWEWAAPFRLVFHWWAASWNGCLAHAAAVGQGTEGVLLVGRGGSGKSTTAVTCIDAGMQYVSDDYSLVTTAPRPRVHALYGSAKLHTAFMHQALPHWASRVALEVGPEQKSVFFLDQWQPSLLAERLDMVAVVLPRLARQTVASLAPTTRGEGLRALAPSSLFQLPDARRETLGCLARITGQLPAYVLHLGRELRSAPAVLEALCNSSRSDRHHAA